MDFGERERRYPSSFLPRRHTVKNNDSLQPLQRDLSRRRSPVSGGGDLNSQFSILQGDRFHFPTFLLLSPLLTTFGENLFET